MLVKPLTKGGASSERSTSQSICWSWHLLGESISVSIELPQPVFELARRCAPILRLPFIRVILLTCLAMLLVWARCPTILSRATFWAEDGWVWYPACYYHGWRCIFIDHTSYLQTFSMLTALLSLPFSLINAPKFFAIVSLGIQAAPAAFLMTGRMAEALPSGVGRGALAILLIATPGMGEVYANLTNAQWHLALLAFMILASSPARNLSEGLFDCLALAISGLSGPFAIFLLPCAIIWTIVRKGRWELIRLSLITLTAAIQSLLIVFHQAARMGHHTTLGSSIERFDNIVLSKIIAVALVGWQTMQGEAWDFGAGWLTSGSVSAIAVSCVIVISMLLFIIIIFFRASWLMRTFLIFVACEFAGSLVDGLPVANTPLWVEFELAVAARYFFHPTIAIIVVFFASAFDRNRFLRWMGGSLLATTIVWAIPSDWGLPPLSSSIYTAFHHDAKIFAKSPVGATVEFPVRPFGMMVLVKK